jgi:GntR family transcriptional regulator/MocR family aminotransferase
VNRKDLRGLVIGYGYAPLAEIERFGPVLAKSLAHALKDFGK